MSLFRLFCCLEYTVPLIRAVDQEYTDIAALRRKLKYPSNSVLFTFIYIYIDIEKLWAYKSHCVNLNIMQTYITQLWYKYDPVCSKFLYKQFFTCQATVSVVLFTQPKPDVSSSASSFETDHHKCPVETLYLWRQCTDEILSPSNSKTAGARCFCRTLNPCKNISTMFYKL